MSKHLVHLELYPPPKLALSESKIMLRGAGILYGNFEISNGGDGELVGTIAPMADFISFSPSSFASNKIQVEYSVDLSGLVGEIQTGAVITTNGGERVLDFHITVNRADVLVRDGVVMADLEDFAEYAKAHPVAARALFGRQDFMMWLLNMGYPSMDIYENFAADPNKERAVDNFLVFNGNKSKAKVIVENQDITHSIGLWEDVVTGSINLRQTTWGYAEANLEVIRGEEWLKLSKNKVSGGDFGPDNLAKMHYMILPKELEGRDLGQIALTAADEQKITIRCSPAAAFDARLDKTSFFFEDRGKLIVVNNTGTDLFIDISCENFIKFEAKRYLISQSAEIDFEVKYGSHRAATLSFKKQLYVETYIHVVAVSSGANYARRLAMTLWSGQ
ncbi:MAG: DUF5717 family protein [Clostridiales bacterium]|jgi:hypothetical protein|nr:DUF5717 family protein [Clostridiales bacterium]